VAGTLLFGEAIPGGVSGVLRVTAFVVVLVGAVALSRRAGPGERALEPAIL